MGLITAGTSPSGQGIIKVFTFASVDADDTFEGPASPKAYWAQSTADPTTNTSASINVSESSGTYTFWPGIESLTTTLFVIV